MASPSEHWIAVRISHTWRSDGSEELRIASSDAQLVEAAMDTSGRLTFRMRGRAPQNEDGADAAAWTLVERLNQFGAHWGEPRRPAGRERGIDFVARADEQELRIQVTRAFSYPGTFRELAQESSVSRTVEIEDAVAALWSSIERKRAYASEDVLLALDATVPAGVLHRSNS